MNLRRVTLSSTALKNWLLQQIERVYWAVRAGLLCKIDYFASLKGESDVITEADILLLSPHSIVEHCPRPNVTELCECCVPRNLTDDHKILHMKMNLMRFAP